MSHVHETQRFLGLELAGAKNQKTSLAVLEHYPKEKKTFLLDIFDRIASHDGQTGDEAVLEVIQEEGTTVQMMGVNVSLELPPCITCTRKACPMPSDCTVPAVKWMREISRKSARARDFTPYTQRPIELWIRHLISETGFESKSEKKLESKLGPKFEIDETLGGNRAPLTARMNFLKRHLTRTPVLEVWPKLSVILLASQLGTPKRTLASYRHLEDGVHSREEILHQLTRQREIFIYDRDMRKLSTSLTAFDAFICAYTVLLSDLENAPTFPKDSQHHLAGFNTRHLSGDPMLVYALRKLAGGIPTLAALITLTFFLLRLAPGGPFDAEQVWPPEIQANINRKYHLDQPIAHQFINWAKDLSHGDLNESFQYQGHPVTEIIFQSLPASLLLGGWALLLATLGGLILGCLAVWKKNSWIEGAILFFSVAGLSLPSYLIASVLILLFSLHLQWFPPALWESPSSMVLPILTLGTRPMAIVARLTRTSIIETLRSNYVRTAYGKGLSEVVVISKHALKNSLIPVISVMGPTAANLITGSFVVEVIFQIPGMGKHFVQAVLNRDYPLVMGVTLVYGVLLTLTNIIVDLLYAWVDPRIRL